MTKAIKNLLEYMLIVYLVLTIFEGITLPSNILYIFATFVLFSIAVFLSTALLNFLTIKQNFLTTLIMTSLLSIGVFFILDTFMPGFSLEQYTFEGIDTGNLVIHSLEVTPIITMVLGGIAYSFITSLFTVLEKSS